MRRPHATPLRRRGPSPRAPRPPSGSRATPDRRARSPRAVSTARCSDSSGSSTRMPAVELGVPARGPPRRASGSAPRFDRPRCLRPQASRPRNEVRWATGKRNAPTSRAPRSCRCGERPVRGRAARHRGLGGPSTLAAQRDGGAACRSRCRPSAHTDRTVEIERARAAHDERGDERAPATRSRSRRPRPRRRPGRHAVHPLHRVAARHPHRRSARPACRRRACWRTAASCAGTRQRSSAPIHQSSSQSRRAGDTAPLRSTVASRLPPSTPMAIAAPVSEPAPVMSPRSRQTRAARPSPRAA